MISKNHCKLHYEDGDEEEDSELDDFHDYNSSYVDGSGMQIVTTEENLNCQYSDTNERLFRSVNGFVILIEILSPCFNKQGLQGTYADRQHRDTVNICREILKLAEVIDYSEEDWDFL